MKQDKNQIFSSCLKLFMMISSDVLNHRNSKSKWFNNHNIWFYIFVIFLSFFYVFILNLLLSLELICKMFLYKL